MKAVEYPIKLMTLLNQEPQLAWQLDIVAFRDQHYKRPFSLLAICRAPSSTIKDGQQKGNCSGHLKLILYVFQPMSVVFKIWVLLCM